MYVKSDLLNAKKNTLKQKTRKTAFDSIFLGGEHLQAHQLEKTPARADNYVENIHVAMRSKAAVKKGRTMHKLCKPFGKSEERNEKYNREVITKCILIGHKTGRPVPPPDSRKDRINCV